MLTGALLGVVMATIFFFQAQAVKHDAQMLDIEAPSPSVPADTMENGGPLAEAMELRAGIPNSFSEVS